VCHADCERERSDLIFFWMAVPCGCVPISARQLNRAVLRMRNELECHTMHRWLTTLVLILPTTPKRVSLTSFATPPDDNEGLYQSGRSSEAVPLSSFPASFRSDHFPLYFSLSSSFFFLFVSPEWTGQTFTQHSEQPSLVSPLLHCTSQSISLPLVAGSGCRLTDCLFCCSIFGILSMQCYTYYHRYPLDRPFYKILVRSRSSAGRVFLTPAPLKSH